MATGIILAGGRSKRFGDVDKAVADLAGVPMIRCVADALIPVIDTLVLNCRADQERAIRETMAEYEHPWTIAIDEHPDAGPTSGMLTGLQRSKSEYALVVACDMPFVDPAVVSLLFDQAQGCDAAIPQLEDEWYQTTQAVYRAEPMAEACREALEAGERKILSALGALEFVVVQESTIRDHASVETFRNINTKAELDAAERAFEKG